MCLIFNFIIIIKVITFQHKRNWQIHHRSFQQSCIISSWNPIRHDRYHTNCFLFYGRTTQTLQNLNITYFAIFFYIKLYINLSLNIHFNGFLRISNVFLNKTHKRFLSTWKSGFNITRALDNFNRRRQRHITLRKNIEYEC